MSKSSLLIVAFLLSTTPIFAQQDPEDPGLQDSLIVGSAEVDSSSFYQFRFIPLYAVTDDSVTYLNIPLEWHAPRGGVICAPGTIYNYPLILWDVIYDTVMTDQNRIQFLGYCSTSSQPCEYPIYTDGERLNFWSLRFIIAPNTPPQVVVIDTFSTAWYGTESTGFVPAFVPGRITIGPVTGVEEEEMESATELRNYPNPFSQPPSFEFSLKKTEHVKLEIYNLLGQRVAMVFDGILSEGHHVVNWRGDVEYPRTPQSMPSGVYFSRLTTSESIVTRKIMLIK